MTTSSGLSSKRIILSPFTKEFRGEGHSYESLNFSGATNVAVYSIKISQSEMWDSFCSAESLGLKPRVSFSILGLSFIQRIFSKITLMSGNQIKFRFISSSWHFWIYIFDSHYTSVLFMTIPYCFRIFIADQIRIKSNLVLD